MTPGSEVFFRRSLSVPRAVSWLYRLVLPPGDIQRQLQRVLALQAGIAICPKNSAIRRDLRLLARRLPRFDPRRYDGDPVLALACNAVFRGLRTKHSSLSHLAGFLAQVLDHETTTQKSELTLATELLRRLGHKPRYTVDRGATFVDPLALLSSSREETLGLCARISAVTACGAYACSIDHLAAFLPKLSLSYARDWDVEAVAAILRACIHARIHDVPACQWAVDWILDQQHDDGRFGLLAPEAFRLGRDVDDWKLHFGPTTSVLWTLAELKQPGFALALVSTET